MLNITPPTIPQEPVALVSHPTNAGIAVAQALQLPKVTSLNNGIQIEGRIIQFNGAMFKISPNDTVEALSYGQVLGTVSVEARITPDGKTTYNITLTANGKSATLTSKQILEHLKANPTNTPAKQASSVLLNTTPGNDGYSVVGSKKQPVQSTF